MDKKCEKLRTFIAKADAKNIQIHSADILKFLMHESSIHSEFMESLSVLFCSFLDQPKLYQLENSPEALYDVLRVVRTLALFSLLEKLEQQIWLKGATTYQAQLNEIMTKIPKEQYYHIHNGV